MCKYKYIQEGRQAAHLVLEVSVVLHHDLEFFSDCFMDIPHST